MTPVTQFSSGVGACQPTETKYHPQPRESLDWHPYDTRRAGSSIGGNIECGQVHGGWLLSHHG